MSALLIQNGRFGKLKTSGKALGYLLDNKRKFTNTFRLSRFGLYRISPIFRVHGHMFFSIALAAHSCSESDKFYGLQ